MGRRDLLSNTIYQRMKQLRNRLKKRNQEEEKRQERADRAKTARWEEHQRQMLQFENYLKKCAQAPKRRRRPPNRASVPPNTMAGSSICSGGGINLEQVHLVETTAENRSYSSGATSRSFRITPGLSPPPSGTVTETDENEQDWCRPGWRSANSSPDSTGKTDLARGLEELDDRSNEMSYPRSNISNHAYSAILSPPPTLPSTPSDSGTILFQTPIPPHETPIIPIIAQPPTPEPPVLPEISITKMATAPSDQQPPKVVKAPKKPKIKKKGKKKSSPKQAKSKSPETSTEMEVKVDPKNKKEVQKKIKDIFTSVNTLPDEELTEEAFDVFLDTIKNLSEYLDTDDLDSQNFDIVDDLSSGFSSRANDYLANDSCGTTPSPSKMYSETPSPDSQTKADALTGKALTTVQMKRLQAAEKRRLRILVVREKQEGIIRYRKVTMAELRLRRQRALMRVRMKIIDEASERDNVHMQRIRLFEMAHLNEKERQARLEQFKQEEDLRLLEEDEMKRMKELRVKEELHQLLERSRERQAEEERLAKLSREWGESEEQMVETGSSVEEEKEEPTDSEVGRRKRLQRNWMRAARHAQNKIRFESMVQKNSQVLYRALVKELISQRQKELITDIPGFSYFLLLKYTLDLDDISDIMTDL
ncbi:putative uncharacterized protein DDB_G0287113 isoform X2 [Bolinopsis microptera]|uniref:putative uncharacterized protein DDB_G0287113 isoform X2 n=1 Tax=Bolinopsis microptera TaxID=2820187 RepID=UPI003079D91A